MGIEPTPSAWKAEVLPLNYTRNLPRQPVSCACDLFEERVTLASLMLCTPSAGASAPPSNLSVLFLPGNPRRVVHLVEGGGFEPPKAEPSDLQSDPVGHLGIPPAQNPGF